MLGIRKIYFACNIATHKIECYNWKERFKTGAISTGWINYQRETRGSKWIGALLFNPNGEEFCYGTAGSYKSEHLKYGDLFYNVFKSAKNKDFNNLYGSLSDSNSINTLLKGIGILEASLEAWMVPDLNSKKEKNLNSRQTCKGELLQKLNESQKALVYSFGAFSFLERELQNLTLNRLIFYEDGSASPIASADNLLPLMAYEIMKLFEMKKTFKKCSCGLWYTRPKNQPKEINHCKSCPSKSKTKGSSTSRVYKGRAKAALKIGRKPEDVAERFHFSKEEVQEFKKEIEKEKIENKINK